jgi:hypothetical protein
MEAVFSGDDMLVDIDVEIVREDYSFSGPGLPGYDILIITPSLFLIAVLILIRRKI